jgi:DNA-binding transcriptional regulator YhcF (GntR family)
LSPFRGFADATIFAGCMQRRLKNCVMQSFLMRPFSKAGTDHMEFHIEKHSSIPAVKQIQEQIKLSMAMGILKTGDTLPSIREIEKQTGINRGQIHRAYLALYQSGLLSPARGRGTAVAMAAVAPHSISQRCEQLSKNTIAEVRQLGISPTAFARYLSGNARRNEYREPFIAYVDPDREIAVQRADQVSQLWQVSVIGLTISELKAALRRGTRLRKVLVNHLNRDSIGSIPPGMKMDIIPVEIHYTKQTIRDLGKTKSKSSILVVLPRQAVNSARFIVGQLHKWMKSRDVEISWIPVRDVASFEQLLNSPQYDRVLITPGARSKVPLELRQSSRVLMLRMQLDPESLEIARIRSGVII